MPRVSFGPLSLDVPGEWTLSTVILSGPISEGGISGNMPTTKAVRSFQQNVILTLEQVGPDETPEKYVRRQIEGLKRAGVQRQDTAKPETVTLASGAEGLLSEQSVVGPNGERVRQLQLVVVREGIAHTAIASNLDGPAYDKSKAAFRQILLSLS